MDGFLETMDQEVVIKLKEKLIESCLQTQCSIEDDHENVVTDMYTGEQFSRKKMIAFLNSLDSRKTINPGSIVYFYDYIADHFPEQTPYCIARIISACRLTNKPKRGIARSFYYFKKYDHKIFSSEMFVALGGAFSDLGKIDTAKECIQAATIADFMHTNSEFIHNLSFALEKYENEV